jgi:cell wall assembly regulator SMI1
MGILGGLCLFGPEESAGESDKWRDLMTSGQGFQAIANPDWDASHSLDPDAVNAVYFAAGWIPLLGEPLEANYLAVDLVPLSSGVPGQVILCGRDEDHKCVVAPDLTALLKALAAECNGGAWEVVKGKSKTQDFFYMKRQGGRLLSACKAREFPPRKGNVQ